MIDAETVPDRIVSAAPRNRRWRMFFRRKSAVASALLLSGVVTIAIFANLLAPYDPNSTDLRSILLPPGSAGHLLGTDQLGRDVLSRLVYGARVSAIAGFGATTVSLIFALPIGFLSGYVGGRFDWFIQRGIEVMLSIPPLVLIFVIAGILGPSLRNAVIALGAFFIPAFVRLIRAEVRNIAAGPLVEAERALGVSPLRIMVRHVLPSVAPAIIVEVSLATGVAIVAEASLAFLGLGATPPTASWGGMIREGFDVIQTDTWFVVMPCVAIAFTVLAVNLFGDGLRDALGRVDR